MDHEVSGKRHVRDGSVTVAEIIGRQPHFVSGSPLNEIELPKPPPVPRLARERPVDEVHPPSLLARVATLTVGTLALLGAVGATAAISGTPPAQPPAQGPAGAPITGENALRPDLVAQRLGYLPQRAPFPVTDTGLPSVRPTTVPSAAAPGPASQQPGAATTTGQPPGSAGSPPAGLPSASSAPASTHETTAEPEQPAEVVRAFYQRLRDKSGDAQSLLSPGLLGSDLPGFLLSWRSVRAVEPIAITTQPDGSVLGTVAVQQANGSWLRLQQHFSLSAAHPPVIDRVELISAQQS